MLSNLTKAVTGFLPSTPCCCVDSSVRFSVWFCHLSYRTISFAPRRFPCSTKTPFLCLTVVALSISLSLSLSLYAGCVSLHSLTNTHTHTTATQKKQMLSLLFALKVNSEASSHLYRDALAVIVSLFLQHFCGVFIFYFFFFFASRFSDQQRCKNGVRALVSSANEILIQESILVQLSQAWDRLPGFEPLSCVIEKTKCSVLNMIRAAY